MLNLTVTTDSHGFIVNTNVLVSGHPAAFVLVEGFHTTDLNGDGFVEGLDYDIINLNNDNFVETLHP